MASYQKDQEIWVWHLMVLTFQVTLIAFVKPKENVQSFCFMRYLYFLIHIAFMFL